MTALEQMLSAILLPLLNRHCGFRTGGIFRDLMAGEGLSRGEWDRMQEDKLGRLLRSAVEHVPFYQMEAYRGAVGGGGARDRLAALPILRRADIQKAGEKLRDPRITRVRRSRTGGTTGEPLEIWKDVSAISVAEAAFWRGKSWAGIWPWDKAVYIRGFGKGSRLGRFRMRCLRKWTVEAFQPGAAERLQVRDLICRVRPVSVEGYVTDLLSLAEGQDLSSAGVRAVLTTGEMLYPEQKAELARAFAAPVFSYYGSNEIGSLAFECEKGTKHVSDEHVILEAVDESGRPVWDEPGRLLVTDLDNFAMPLIRYELGDVGTLTRAPCACGRTLLVLQELLGRQQDAWRNKPGDKLSAAFFAARFRDLRRIERIQLVQKDARTVEILYEGDEARAAPELKSVADEIRARLGEQMQVQAARVDQIPLTARGKRPLIRGMKA